MLLTAMCSAVTVAMKTVVYGGVGENDVGNGGKLKIKTQNSGGIKTQNKYKLKMN
jgi:hypothetical protein